MSRTLLALPLALALAACQEASTRSDDPLPGAAATIAAAAPLKVGDPPAAFGQCSTCHSFAPASTASVLR